MRIQLLLATLLAAGPVSAPQGSTPPPIEVEYVVTTRGKPPERFYGLRLTLRNTGDQPRWFVLPTSGDDRLGDKTARDTYGTDVPFESARYPGDGDNVVVVSFYGRDSLKLLLLPPHATLRFDRYEMAAWKDIAGFDEWEASSALVNGKTRLEDWLPYRVASDARVTIPKGADGDYLDFDRKTYRKRTDYSAQAVRNIFLKVSEKRSVTIRAMPER